MDRRGTAWIRLLSSERGALFWLPGLAAAAWLVLFAMHLAPGGTSLFTRTTGLRVVVGAWRADGECGPAALRTADALRRALQRHGDVTVVDPGRVAPRLAAAGVQADEDPGAFLHAVRPLNAHLGVEARVTCDGAAVTASVRAYAARSQRVLLEHVFSAPTPDALGESIADSVRAIAFVPHVF